MPSFQRKGFGKSEMSVTDEHQDGNELGGLRGCTKRTTGVQGAINNGNLKGIDYSLPGLL